MLVIDDVAEHCKSVRRLIVDEAVRVCLDGRLSRVSSCLARHVDHLPQLFNSSQSILIDLRHFIHRFVQCEFDLAAARCYLGFSYPREVLL